MSGNPIKVTHFLTCFNNLCFSPNVRKMMSKDKSNIEYRILTQNFFHEKVKHYRIKYFTFSVSEVVYL